MINSIIEAIGVALNEEFNSDDGEKYTIYANEVKQGLKEPCFFISCINPTQRLFFNKRYFRENGFCIQYFPEDKNWEKEECNAVIERLYCCLEWLTVTGDLVRGTKMRGETVDGVLSFFVNYDMFVYFAQTKTPIMDELQHETLTKGTSDENGG